MTKIPWLDDETNEKVLRKAGTRRKILKTIRLGRLEFLGHIIWTEVLEELMATDMQMKNEWTE